MLMSHNKAKYIINYLNDEFNLWIQFMEHTSDVNVTINLISFCVLRMLCSSTSKATMIWWSSLGWFNIKECMWPLGLDLSSKPNGTTGMCGMLASSNLYMISFYDSFSPFTLNTSYTRGLPYWLREVPGIIFRSDNEPYKVNTIDHCMISISKQNE
jgi:hypothetical protein